MAAAPGALTHDRTKIATASHSCVHALLGLTQARSLAEHDEDVRGLPVVLTRNAARNMRRRHHRARPHEAGDSSAPKRTWSCSDAGEIQRSVLTLRMREELSNEEVARSLELTPGHVAVLLHRAKRSMVECMVS